MKHLKASQKSADGQRKVDSADKPTCLKHMGSNGGYTMNYATQFASLHGLNAKDIIVIIDQHGVYVVRGNIDQDGNVNVHIDKSFDGLDDFAVCVHEFREAKSARE